MDFMKIARVRQSCRHFDEDREVEQEKLTAVLEAARFAPSACNGQPYHMTVCTGETAKAVAAAINAFGMNKFAVQAPIMIVFSETPYVRTAALGAKLRGIDYRSIDIGCAVSYLTAEAAAQGLGSCILGWANSKRIEKLCELDSPVRLVVALGYAHPDETLRKKVRKELSELVTYK